MNKTILHVLNSCSYSGAENVVISIIKEFNNARKDYNFIYVSLEGPIREYLIEEGLNYDFVNKMCVSEIRRLIRKHNPDIIHAHDFTAGIITSLSTYQTPIINHLHNNSPWIKMICLKSIIYGLSCTRYKKILTVSKSIMDEYIFGKIFKNKIVVIGNPVNLEDINCKVTESDIHEYSDITFLGRLSHPKNPHLFIEIVNDLVKKFPNLKAAIIGDGDLREEVEINIFNLGLSKHIKMYGFQKNPYGLLNNTKLLCMPSNWEGFGLAAVEALALAKPVVASPVGGLINIVDNTCGDLCIFKEEFVNAISNLLSNAELYRNKQLGAKKRAEYFDNMKTYRDALIAVYKSLL